MNKMPRTFCVTLKETPLRTKSFLDAASKIGLPFEFFYGVFGQRLGLIPKLANELECPGKNNFMGENGLACNLSHLILWNVLKHLPEEEFLIFEDDAVFCPDFINKFQSLYSNLPTDWEFVYVGWVPNGRDNAPVVVNEGITIRLPNATHAYLVKKSALEILCEGLLPIQSNIDLTIVSRCLPKLKYYVFDPPIVNQKSYSNIKDPVWMSLIYDWKADLYGFRRRLLRELNVDEGWYHSERNNDGHWKWSQPHFTIQLPASVEGVNLVFTSPVKNSLSIFSSNRQMDFELNIGDNEIHMNTVGCPTIIGKLHFPFIPAEADVASTDTRPLGICLKKMIIDIGATQIPLDASDL